MNLTIKSRLILAFAILIVITGITFIIGNLSLSQMNDRLNTITDITSQKIKLGARINQDIIFVSRAEKNLILAKSEREMNEISSSVQNTLLEMDKRIEQLSDLVDQEGQTALKEFETSWSNYMTTFEEVKRLTYLNSNFKAQSLSRGDADENFTNAMNALESHLARASKDKNVEKISLVSAIQNNINNIQAYEKDIILANKEEDMNSIDQLSNMEENEMMANIRKLTQISGDDFDDFNLYLNAYLKLNEDVISLAKENANNQAFELAANEGRRSHDKATSLLVSIVDKNDNQLTIDAQESDENYASSVNFMIATIVIGIIIAILIAYWIISNISKSLNEADNAIRALAKGDFTVEINETNNDEIGEMLKGLKKMVDKVKGVLTDILEGASYISSASEQMSSTSQQLSAGATEQASSTEQVSSSMEQMASNIKQNTDNAQETEKIAVTASNDIEIGNKSVKETVISMKTIAEKISIIGDISRQTNLLALNAAVEAARAGEHGKGFAVVAAEVRKLAERSQSAAVEIDDLSNSSVTKAEDSGKILERIVPNIQKTAQLVQEISAASAEQATGAEQVNGAIEQINVVAQQTSSASEQTASGAEELAAQAEQLLSLVSFFKIDNAGRGGSKLSSKNRQAVSSKVKKANTKQSKQSKAISNGVDIDLGDSYAHSNGSNNGFEEIK